MTKSFTVSSSKRQELINITEEVEKAVSESKTKEGICFVVVPHSTAALVLTENEEGLKKDWLKFLNRLVKSKDFSAKGGPTPGWEHNRIDDNADSHILAGILGQGKVLPIENGKLQRGTWQQIFLVELDGPRERKVIVKIIKE